MTENALYTLWLLLAGKQGTTKTFRLIKAMEAREAYHATKADAFSTRISVPPGR